MTAKAAALLARSGSIAARTAVYALLLGLVFVFVFPFIFMIVTSFKSNADLYDYTVNWVPTAFKYENYIIAFRALEYVPFFLNSVLVTVVATIGHLLACSFVGYGFARYEFPLKRLLFFIVIIAFIVPVQTLIVPLYMQFVQLGWNGSYLPLLVPAFFGLGLKGALYVFTFRQFYLGIPKELEDAAKIDGCGFLRTYWFIVLPVARAVFLVVIVLSVTWHWNDYYEPSIYAPATDLTLLPARLDTMVRRIDDPDKLFDSLTTVADEERTLNNAVLMAGTFMVIVPVLALFGFLQRKFMQGIERTGLTGE